MIPPVGFRFRPSDEEIIIGYLLKKVRGQELSWDGIHEFDLYGEKAPWEMFDGLHGEEEKHYLFTSLKKFSKRVARTAGCGTWHEGYCNQIYDSQGQHVIGLNKQFCFKVKHGLCTKKSDWIMHEFSLAGIFLAGEQERSSTWVLCTVHKKGSETRKSVKRCFGGVQIPGTITSVEAPTPCHETPQARNTNVVLLEDGTQQRKRMRCDVQSDVLQANEIPLSIGSSQYEFTPSPNSVDVGEDNTRTTDLEIHMGCFPTNYNADSEFSALYGNLPQPSTTESEHLSLDSWVDISNDKFFASVFD